ncbi:hypothetical protein [Sphingorhabdus contaminans]|uniref:hypothetical protein n=1 Tax=Sphingorhabdus contaminans TaxID=1343899 RepID=UPI003D2A93DF
MTQYVIRSRPVVGDCIVATRGDMVERCFEPDNGAASTDTKRTGVRHLTVRRLGTEFEPWFTIPFSKLKRVSAR